MLFLNANKDRISLAEVLERLKDFVLEDISATYDLVVGSDSLKVGTFTNHVTVVFLWNLTSRKFRLFHNKERILHHGQIDLATRIITETVRSLEVANFLLESPLADMIGRNNFEVHADVGHFGNSRKMISACTGMITGSGFKCKIKPDAFVASSIADHYC